MQTLNLATLEKQNEILAKPGGVNWSEKSFQTNQPVVGTHESNTYLDITGSGYIIGLKYESSTTQRPYTIQIDEGDIYSIRGAYGDFTNLFPLRFNSKIKIASNIAVNDTRGAWVVLD
ncbi:MAG: hypothetical protein SCK28_04565 [Bacillota bacterium]|nr:hypothetical protein [Bacillota bacterium]